MIEVSGRGFFEELLTRSARFHVIECPFLSGGEHDDAYETCEKCTEHQEFCGFSDHNGASGILALPGATSMPAEISRVQFSYLHGITAV